MSDVCPGNAEDLAAGLRQQVAMSGQAHISTETLSHAIAARCHEEVRVWVENFCRANRLVAIEAAMQGEFHLHTTPAED